MPTAFLCSPRTGSWKKAATTTWWQPTVFMPACRRSTPASETLDALMSEPMTFMHPDCYAATQQDEHQTHQPESHTALRQRYAVDIHSQKPGNQCEWRENHRHG